MKRKIITRSPIRVVGRHASRKMMALIPWESQIEKAYYEWIEVSPDVHEFYAQPETFRDKGRRYTPDVFVVDKTGSYYVEVKPDKFLDDPEGMALFLTWRAYINGQGFPLVLVTEMDIFERIRRKNIVLLLRYCRSLIDLTKIDKAKTILGNNSMQVGKFFSCIGDGWSFPDIYLLIAQGYIRIDLDKDINGQSNISLNTWGGGASS